MILERIYDWAQRQPEQPALIWNDFPLSYRQFWNAIRSARDYLGKEDLPTGGNAIILVRALADTWILVMALRALGLNTICIRSNEQTKSLKVAGAACLVTTPAEAEASGMPEDVSSAKIVIMPSPIDAVKTTEGLLPPCGDRHAFGGHILYTSGTTGDYKKLLLSGKFEERRNQTRARQYSFNASTVYHGFDFELWTGTGFKTSSAVWYAGGCVILDERKENFKHFFASRFTIAKLLPWQLKSLLLLRKDAPADPASDFTLCIGGGFLPADLAEQAIREITGRLSVNYSSTEINSVRLHADLTVKDDVYWLMPTDADRVQIVDERGDECLFDRQGELRILLADIDCHEYLDDEEATVRVFRDGCFYPGDMAVRREDGRIRILGRVGDVIVLKGEKLATAPMEQEIQRRLRVEEVCVFSGLSKGGEDELIIVIQSNRGILKSELETIAHKFPRFDKVRFSIRPNFPRMATGRRKINRMLLKQLVFADLEKSLDRV